MDEQLRELERRWNESGASEDGAALLAARLRAGACDPVRLELAARVGIPSARAALDQAPAPRPDDLEAWAEGFCEESIDPTLGTLLLFQVGLSVTRLLLPRFRGAAERKVPERFVAILEACLKKGKVSKSAAKELEQRGNALMNRRAQVSAAGRAFHYLGKIPNNPVRLGKAFTGRALAAAAEALGAEVVVAAVHEGVARWALGLEPPERTAAPPTPSAPAAGELRRLEHPGEGSPRFWEVQLVGREVKARFGKVGSTGRFRTWTLDDPAVAERELNKRLRAKLREGYVEV